MVEHYRFQRDRPTNKYTKKSLGFLVFHPVHYLQRVSLAKQHNEVCGLQRIKLQTPVGVENRNQWSFGGV